jgi:glucosamine 6-phosphate synthetase-like amidotransferase/phosphosugar isomerase protein
MRELVDLEVQMKASSVQGYVLALTFLNMYEEDGNKIDDIHIEIKKELESIARNLILRKHNIQKQIKVAWTTFNTLVDEDYTVSVLAFVFSLVVFNPTISKHKKLKDLCMEARKVFAFKKDTEIVQAKVLVNKFYSIKHK